MLGAVLIREGREVSVQDLDLVVTMLSEADSPDAVIWEDFLSQVRTACVLTEVFGGCQVLTPDSTPDRKVWEIVSSAT